MAFTPPHELQLQGVVDPVCDETLYLDSSWKSYYDDKSNISLSDSDCVPQSLETLPDAEPDYSCSPSTETSSLRVLGNQDGYPWLDNKQYQQWQNKRPQTWSHHDVREWIENVATMMQLTNLRLDAFADVDGSMLCKMRMEQFQSRDPSYGDTLCNAFSQLSYSPYPDYRTTYEAPYEAAEKSLISIDKYIHLHNISFDKDDTFPSLPPFETSFSPKPNIKGENPKTIPKPEPELPYDEPPLSPTDSEASSTVSQHKPSRRGRSKGKLWEFVLNLLLDGETNPSIIKWEDRTNGVFRIVKSDQVAKKWGVRKSNPSMTYEKMSRAMRYYYRKCILERIDGRRLVYKFGSNAKGWKL